MRSPQSAWIFCFLNFQWIFFFSLAMASDKEILQRQLEEMQNYIDDRDIKNPAVSKASVGWHLAHNLKVFNSIFERLRASKPQDYKPEFSLKKRIVFLTGTIPRGKASAPKSVLPGEQVQKETLFAQLEEARLNLHSFESLDEKVNFYHPYFSYLNKKETEKFLKIHTKHHLKIIRDILTIRHK